MKTNIWNTKASDLTLKQSCKFAVGVAVVSTLTMFIPYVVSRIYSKVKRWRRNKQETE